MNPNEKSYLRPNNKSNIPAVTQLIQSQTPVVWMAQPPRSNCPPGLEYLTQINQLLVKQQIDLMEIVTDMDMNNKYVVLNTLGQLVFYAKEDSDCCLRYFCGSNRSFTIRLYNNDGSVVMELIRPLKCHCFGPCCNCSECARDEVEVHAPPGTVIGYVRQLYEGGKVRYAILDENRDIVLRLHGPSYCYCYCPGDDYPLDLVTLNGDTVIGRITKQWSSWAQEMFTEADNFGLEMPIDLDVKVKATVLAAVFLIDFMYFEDKQKNNNNRRGNRNYSAN